MPGTPKQFNTHKHPGANHQPNHKAADRKMRAEVRQEFYDKLSLEEKIARLPSEPHAKKQRARLLALLEKRNAPKQAPAVTKGDVVMVAADTSPKQNKQKKYMKGAK